MFKKENVASMLERAPVIYADVALNFSQLNGVVKFYLGRVDPSPEPIEINEVFVNVSGQVIMPATEFIKTFAFLERMVLQMAANSTTFDETLSLARKTQE